MIQLKVYPFEGAPDTDAIFLDLYETQPIKLTLSVEDVTSADATSVFSRTFKVPATRGNNEFFENAYELDGIDFDITIKKPAEILVDGAEFKIGHVRLQKIFSNADLDKTDYELLFLGETRDFSSAIGEASMCQLTMTDFSWDDLPVSYTNAADFSAGIGQQEVRDSWDAFPQQSSATAGYADGDLLFPLIDHGNDYDSDGNLNSPTVAIGSAGSSEQSFTKTTSALPAARFKPMIRAKRIWDQIFQDSGYTYESNFLDSEQFRHMYVSAFGNRESIAIGVEQDIGGVFGGGASAQTFEYFESANGNNDINSYLYCSNQVTASPGYTVNIPDVGSTSGGSYFTAPGSASIGGAFYQFDYGAQVDAQIENSDYGYTEVNCAVQLCIVDAPGGNILYTLDVGNFASNGNWSSSTYTSANGGYQPQAGDIFQVFVTAAYSYDITSVDQAYWKCTAAPGNYAPTRDLDCEYQQIDFIKDVITMFRLVMQPSVSRPNHFIIEPWKDFISSGEVYDWSNKMIREKDFVSEPLFNTQSAQIEFTKQEDEDYINKFHQDNNKHAYGWLRFDSQNELLKGKRDVEVLGIAPTPIDQIITMPSGTANDSFILPQIFEVEDGKRVPIKPKTRFLFYNGLVTTYGTTWYFATSASTEIPMTTYPLVTPYEYWPITNIAESPGPPPVEAVNTLNLNFANDTRYYMDPAPNAALTEIPNTLFEIFWARYISSLYNKFSRRVTAYFTLNNVDLQTLTFDDVIFVDGKYYRPEKIIDAEIGQRTAVKVQLINILDQRPVWRPEPLTGFSIIVSDGICAGEEGSIQVTSNGTPPFNWSYVGASGSNNSGTYNAPVGQAPYIFTIENVPLGNGVLQVEDNFGRSAEVSYTVNAASSTPVEATWVETDATDCSAPCNGAVTVTPSGGTGPYTITWQDGGTGLARTGLCPEDYLFYITDSLGCQSQTYEASVSCVQTQNYFEVREHLNNCTQLSVQTYSMDTTQQLSQGDTISLNEKKGCFVVMGMTTVTPSYTLNQTFPDCATCGTPPTPTSYEVQTCNTGANTYYVNRNVTLTPGQAVEINGVAGCFEVVGDSTNAVTNTVSQVFADCATCTQTPPGFVYYAFFCDGSFSPRYFASTISLQAGDVLEIQDGFYIGKCVQIISQNNSATPQGNLDTSTVHDDCNSCQGISPQECTTVVVSGTGAEISYEQNGNTNTVPLLPGTYSYCGSNFTVISGSATFTGTGRVCNSNFDCRIVRPKTSCHIFNGGNQLQGTTFEYQNSSGQIVQRNVNPFIIESVCAVINSITIISGNGSFQDQQSLCTNDNECFSGGPRP